MPAVDRAAPRPAAPTGEWAGALREVFGEYRAAHRRRRPAACGRRAAVDALRGAASRTSPARRRTAADRGRQARPGRPLERRRDDRGRRAARRLRGHLLGHPAVAAEIARQAASRRTPTSSASRSCPGSHLEITRQMLDTLAAEGAGEIPVVVGGIVRRTTRRAGGDGRRRRLHAARLRPRRRDGSRRRPDRCVEVARLVTLVERTIRPPSRSAPRPLAAIESESARARVVGVHRRARRRQVHAARGAGVGARGGSDRRIAIVAVDPSSAVTGGALLGDRTRIRVPRGPRRSSACRPRRPSRAAWRRPPIRWCAAAAAPVRLVLVETLGVGQSEDRHPPRRRRDYLLAAARGRQRAAPEGGPDGGARRDRRDEVRRRRTWRIAPSPTCAGDRPGAAGRDDPAARRQRPHGSRHRRPAPPRSLRRLGPEQPRDDWFVTRAVRTAHGRLGAARLAEHGPGSGGSLGRAPGRGARPISSFVRLSPPHPASRPLHVGAPPRRYCTSGRDAFSRSLPYYVVEHIDPLSDHPMG